MFPAVKCCVLSEKRSGCSKTVLRMYIFDKITDTDTRVNRNIMDVRQYEICKTYQLLFVIPVVFLILGIFLGVWGIHFSIPDNGRI